MPEIPAPDGGPGTCVANGACVGRRVAVGLTGISVGVADGIGIVIAVGARGIGVGGGGIGVAVGARGAGGGGTSGSASHVNRSVLSRCSTPYGPLTQVR